MWAIILIQFSCSMTPWDVARVTVRLGDHNIKSNFEVAHVEKKVIRVVRHRNFDGRTLYSDIAILTLDAPVQYTTAIRPVCLPAASRQYSGEVATVIGWGSLRESKCFGRGSGRFQQSYRTLFSDGPQPAILQKVSVPIWSNELCRYKYGAAAPGGIIDSMLCAGQDSKDSCSVSSLMADA